MTAEGRDALRRPESFDDAAADYAAFRKPYPREVVEALVGSVGIGKESRVLEIACGTGQLSLDFARLGCRLIAVEMGRNLARLARRNLADFANATIEVSRFESWTLPGETFDAVVCANAFHWLDPEVRFAKSAQALRPGGALAIVHPQHVGGGTRGFFEDTQPYYLEWGLSDDPDFVPPTATSVPPAYPEFDERPEFGLVERNRLEIPRTFSTESYVGLLRTDSLVNTLEPGARQGFLDDIAHLIESKYDGEVSRNFVYEVVVARRL